MGPTPDWTTQGSHQNPGPPVLGAGGVGLPCHIAETLSGSPTRSHMLGGGASALQEALPFLDSAHPSLKDFPGEDKQGKRGVLRSICECHGQLRLGCCSSPSRQERHGPADGCWSPSQEHWTESMILWFGDSRATFSAGHF